jgi:GDPmannose 4,6-dehydratase
LPSTTNAASCAQGTYCTRRTSNAGTARINHILDKITLIPGDITDPFSLVKSLQQCKPYFVINLAAQSFVKASWDQSLLTAQTTGIGVLNILEAIKLVDPTIKFLQASSSEQFGLMKDGNPLNEQSPFLPRSPYSCAKIFGHYQTINFRESYGMWACCPIMFNYESPRRDNLFVTKKITQAACKIKLGLQSSIKIMPPGARCGHICSSTFLVGT